MTIRTAELLEDLQHLSTMESSTRTGPHGQAWLKEVQESCLNMTKGPFSICIFKWCHIFHTQRKHFWSFYTIFLCVTIVCFVRFPKWQKDKNTEEEQNVFHHVEKVMFTKGEKNERNCCDFSPSTLSHVIYLIITEGPLWMISRRHWLKAISFELLMLCINALLATCICTRTHTHV